MSLQPLADSSDMYLVDPRSRYGDGAERDGRYCAWRLESKSRRHHELWRTLRRQHGHKGRWEDCTTLSCAEDRKFLEALARPSAGAADGTP